MNPEIDDIVVVTIDCGQVEYSQNQAAVDIEELIGQLTDLQDQGATHVVGLSYPEEAPRILAMTSPEDRVAFGEARSEFVVAYARASREYEAGEVCYHDAFDSYAVHSAGRRLVDALAALVDVALEVEAANVVGLSGNYRGAQYVKLGEPNWEDD